MPAQQHIVELLIWLDTLDKDELIRLCLIYNVCVPKTCSVFTLANHFVNSIAPVDRDLEEIKQNAIKVDAVLPKKR